MGCVGGTLPRWTAADKYSLQAIKDEWIFHIESSKPYRDPRINTRYIHPSTHRPIEIGESKYISRFSAFNFALRDWAVDNVRMTRIAHSFCFKWTPRIKHGPVIHRAILFIQRSIISWTGLWAEVLVFLLFFSWYFCFANNIKRNQTNVFIPFLSFLSLVFSRVQDSYCGAKILSFLSKKASKIGSTISVVRQKWKRTFRFYDASYSKDHLWLSLRLASTFLFAFGFSNVFLSCAREKRGGEVGARGRCYGWL